MRLCLVPKLDIETVHNFCDFFKALLLQNLRDTYFFELVDNGIVSCTAVVGANSLKWGHFEGICARLSVPLDIAGWWEWSKKFGQIFVITKGWVFHVFWVRRVWRR